MRRHHARGFVKSCGEEIALSTSTSLWVSGMMVQYPSIWYLVCALPISTSTSLVPHLNRQWLGPESGEQHLALCTTV